MRLRRIRATILVLCGVALVAVIAGMGVGRAPAAVAPVGAGFNLNASDLRFILRQIKIAERHAATRTPANPCGTLIGSGPDQIPDTGNNAVELPMGLRTVDGSCNNLVAGRQNFAKSELKFPRALTPQFRAAETGDPDGPGPAPAGPTSYTQSSGIVIDSSPRTISNLIVDQTATNPTAVEVAGPNPVVTPSGAFFTPNVAPDTGLSAPFNVWFIFFGQFFDHGLDLVKKGGNGTVFMPLTPDDPLFRAGPDNIPNTGDDPPNFMLLTRATHSGDHEHTNVTNPLVDQSQTYTSHASHQVFLREYANNANGRPVSTGRLITGPGGGMSDWATVKAQALNLLGIQLRDTDVFNIPLLATDPYGRFLRGPNGFPQLVKLIGGVETLVEGNPAAPINTDNAATTNQGFLDDIAHHAVPGPVDHDNNPATPKLPAVADTDQGTTDDGNPATYDDEMLGAHFMAGDGRVNENIALTSVHHIFHSEHNRLSADIKTVLVNEDPTMVSEWQLGPGVWNGERIFQAARFVTEMEYQHLAFEEFIRKIQPMVNVFAGYHTEINPAIRAEFAHTVYRFGHSMLAESVDRVRADGTRADVPLLDAFLNPPSLLAGGLTAEQAVGSVVRGTTRQVGNDIDELVTEAVRNRLLGLPLDLPAINIARGRDTGIPPLNEARRQFFRESNNAALMPYQSWADFAFNLKHPSALANFVAAYGTHPSVKGATTIAAKRAAAQLLVAADATNPATPTDAVAFLNSTGAWANGPGGVTITGVDDIDYWMGGLAEKQFVFGGFLGATFNYVFERQMEDLQNGDRFYYLSRTAGLNLLTQLEGNSFAELIERNTDAQGLPADVFSRPDLIFDVSKLGTTGPITDDPATEYDESTLLVRMGDGTIRFGGPEHVVFNGTARNDRIWSSEGDDTIRGDDGDDWMQGGDGNDNHIGGLGDDILLDPNGDDTLKGGDGNDTLSSGQGFGGDLNQGGRGTDFIVGGNDFTETLAGPGNDFVFGGDDSDEIFGDDGDDWIDGGQGANAVMGDNGAPFDDDPNTPGNDVIDGDGMDQDMHAEGGDDIMMMGAGVQRAEGVNGFDWSTHKLDPLPANSDMNLVEPAVPTLPVANRDRFRQIEGLSGWFRDDILRGDDADATVLAPGNVLTPAGVARIAGLQDVLGGATTFNAGNIILGGAGSDLLEGRGGDDILDGDRWLDVQISVRDRLDPTIELKRVDGMSALRADVIAGSINPGQLRIVREIRTEAPGTDIDTAAFSDVRANYLLVTNADGSRTVAHVRNGGGRTDGADTLRNIERLQFADVTIDAATGQALAAAVSLTSASSTFADQIVGTTSAPQTVTLTNTGNVGLSITGVALAGANPGDFILGGTCGAPLTILPGKSCTITVSFAPAATGPRSASVQITTNAPGSPHSIALSGNGTAQPPTVLLGAEVVQPSVDFNAAGLAEAFRVTASTTGTLATLRVFVDATSTATSMIAGLYSNSATGHPGALLGRGTLTGPLAGAWNNVPLANGVSVTAGTVYWIALLSPTGAGELRFRDRCCGGGQPAESSSQTTLANLPDTWTTGQSFNDGPLSAVGLGGIVAGDTTAPTVSISSPAAGDVSRTIDVTAAADDNTAVAGVQFLLDGNPLGDEDTAAPYSVAWNTTTAANGPHTLSARARDGAGNTRTSLVVDVNVNNAAPPAPPAAPTVLLGNQTIEPSVDFNAAGLAEAFQTTATASGTLTGLRVFVDATSTATTLVAGLYSDAGGHPGSLLAKGTLSTITNGELNTVPVPATAVTAGTTYWIAILGPSGGGTLRFRDRCCGGGSPAETSAAATLTSLPATWSTGTVFSDGPLSAFGVG